MDKIKRNVVYFSKNQALNIGILVGEIRLIVTNDTQRAFREAMKFYDKEDKETDGISVVQKLKSGQIIIILNISSTPEIVCHECFHVVNFSFDNKHAYIMDHTANEHFAYYMGKTFAVVNDAFLKIKKQFEKRIVKK